MSDKQTLNIIETDVVVIGSGGAGLPAATAALEGGARVVIVEKRGVTGGNAPFANGIFACESPLQRKLMVDVPKDEVYKNAVEWYHYDWINPRLLRAYINKTGDTIRWLMDKGVEFEIGPDAAMYPNQLPTWHIAKKENPNQMSRFAPVMRKLHKECEEKGAQIFLKTECKKILQAEDGSVRGVLAVGEDGVEYEIKAKCVIMATGGFMGRKDLLKKYFPFYEEDFFGFYVPNMGDGLTLAEEAGAALEGHATLVRETCHSSDAMKEHFLTAAAREPNTMWVNKLGRRFVEETSGRNLQIGANAVLSQPGKKCFTLYDDNLVQEIVDYGYLVPRYPNKDENKQFKINLQEVATRKEWVIQSDNWDEIAEWIGCDAAVLKASVEEYNSFCAQGYDETFVKDRRYLKPLLKPPFYAIKFGVMVVETCGPVRVNENLEVLNKEYQPIPGYYSAGVIVAGWQGHDCNGEHLFGSELGFSINSGRIAGENAAKYALGKEAK